MEFLSKVAIVIFLFLAGALSAAGSEREIYLKIKKDLSASPGEPILKEADKFIKNYPSSGYLPELLYLSAAADENPDSSLNRYMKCFAMRSGHYSELSALKACQILHLKSSWKELRSLSLQGLALKGRYKNQFRKFAAEASIMTGDYSEALAHNRQLLDNERDYESLAANLLSGSFIKKNTGGFSREYIYNIRETAIGFYESEYMPTALFLLGEFYENSRDYDRAWSAYSDLAAHFPDSPESEYAGGKISALKKFNPVRKGYIPTDSTVKDAPALDISPDDDYRDDESSSVYYAVSMGPFSSSKEAGRLRRISGLENSKVAKTRSGYAIFAGRFTSKEEAYRMKIRLAEEYGLNGHITRISEKGGRTYIYGE